MPPPNNNKKAEPESNIKQRQQQKMARKKDERNNGVQLRLTRRRWLIYFRENNKKQSRAGKKNSTRLPPLEYWRPYYHSTLKCNNNTSRTWSTVWHNNHLNAPCDYIGLHTLLFPSLRFPIFSFFSFALLTIKFCYFHRLFHFFSCYFASCALRCAPLLLHFSQVL